MSWNYRVIKTKDGWGVHEVYYSVEGRITSWTSDTVYPYGQTEEEFRRDMEAYQASLLKPALDEEGLLASLEARAKSKPNEIE